MAGVTRDEDGKVVENFGDTVSEEKKKADHGDITVPFDSKEPIKDDFYDRPTVPMDASQPHPSDSRPGGKPGEDKPTDIIVGRSLPPDMSSAQAESSSQTGTSSMRGIPPTSAGTSQILHQHSNSMADPVTGWLVVVKGPGLGSVVELGYGMNTIGRSEQDKVQLPFGDGNISRSKHASIIYDPKMRKYYLQQGDGRNLTYINNEPVLQPTEISNRCEIELGSTLLKFIAFCGEEFDWQDIQEEN